MPAVTSINGASMLAEAPLWLQEWARSRNDTTPPADPMIAALGEPPAYLKNRAASAPSLAARTLKALTPWSAYDEVQLRSALAVIPAIDRDIWLRVGMAIHEAGWGGAASRFGAIGRKPHLRNTTMLTKCERGKASIARPAMARVSRWQRCFTWPSNAAGPATIAEPEDPKSIHQ